MQETRLYNPDPDETFSMRSKEDAHDYRYFPEPDLVPLRISDAVAGAVSATMPELPGAERARFIGELRAARVRRGGADGESRASRSISRRWRSVSGDPKMAANWVMGDLAALLKAEGKEIAESPVSAENLGRTGGLIASGELSGKLAKGDLSEDVRERATRRPSIVEREGLKQISDTGALEKSDRRSDRGESRSRWSSTRAARRR